MGQRFYDETDDEGWVAGEVRTFIVRGTVAGWVYICEFVMTLNGQPVPTLNHRWVPEPVTTSEFRPARR